MGRRLEESGVDFISSHSPGSEGVGPALYLADPIEEDCSRSALRVSQPDIVIAEMEAEKGVKARQYDLLVDRSGSVDFKIFWKEDEEELVEGI